MRIEIDDTTFDLETADGSLLVSIPKNGYDEVSIDVVRRYADARETETGLVLDYPLLSDEVSFREAAGRASTRLERLSLAQKLVACAAYQNGFRVPMIHPDNLYLHGELLRVVHFGLQQVLAPRAFDQAFFLSSLQAMVLQVFRPKVPFDQLFNGASSLSDKFSVMVRQTTTVDELFAFIDAQLQAEHTEVSATRVQVHKGRYGWVRAIGAIGVVAGVVAGVFAWQNWNENRLQSAIIESQARFLVDDYAGALSGLADFSVGVLPTSAKYVLAVSSIKLDELTATQKQAILNNVSEKSDDVTLNYWIAIGRGEFKQALDYAQNLGDNQLILLAYTDLYQATKLNSQMSGEKKQELLDKYSKSIDELTAQLAGGEVAQR